jgi:hypothetical protein
MSNNFASIIISKVKKILKFFIFIVRYKFIPPPLFSDMSGYEILLDVIIQKKIYQIKGDFVEVGSFLGGGTYKLSRLIEKLSPIKKIYSVDIFEPGFDKTSCTGGFTMAELYNRAIKDRKQLDIYRKITKNCTNIITLVGDSKKISLPCKNIAFAYIDGNHSPEYVLNDFYLVWNRISSGGIIAFDDYGYDLPQVTKTIDWLIMKENREISKIWTAGVKTIFIQKK